MFDIVISVTLVFKWIKYRFSYKKNYYLVNAFIIHVFEYLSQSIV